MKVGTAELERLLFRHRVDRSTEAVPVILLDLRFGQSLGHLSDLESRPGRLAYPARLGRYKMACYA